MSHIFYFDVPVYRCSREEYDTEVQVEESAFLKDCGVYAGDSHEFREQLVRKFRSTIHAWRFNEIIGWIRLYSHGTHIKGEYFCTKAKRIDRRSRRKEFEYKGKILELPLLPEDSGTSILRMLLEEMSVLAKTREFSNRYIDIEILKTIGAYVDWARLVSDISHHKEDPVEGEK